MEPLGDMMGESRGHVTGSWIPPIRRRHAGTGEGFFNVDAVRGAGIFKTTNGGGTWAQVASTNNSSFH